MSSIRYLFGWLVGVACLLLVLPISAAAAPAPGAKEFRILHIMSYHSPWRWTDRQLEGFQEEMKGLPATYKVFQMDTKRLSATESKERKGLEARALIESWKPDLVYSTDDDAQEYVARHYVNAKIPFVFSGVNNQPAAYGFAGSSNVTGVLEQEHFVQSVLLARKIVPNARRIALIFDDAKMWEPVRARIESAMPQLAGMTIVAADTVLSFADYKRKIAEYQNPGRHHRHHRHLQPEGCRRQERALPGSAALDGGEQQAAGLRLLDRSRLLRHPLRGDGFRA
jgi:ABC-type uncharacterized transport system substrate-binding protein